MAVLKPLKVVIINYPENQIEELQAINNPEDPSMGSRALPFSREIYIEHDDFMEIPPPKFFRLTLGGEVRLRYAYIIKCEKIIKNSQGNIIELHCSYDPDTRSGTGSSIKKVKGTIHWVSAHSAFEAEVRLYDRLFTQESPDSDREKSFLEFLNPLSLQILKNCKLEQSLKNAPPDERFQFERLGYFCLDTQDSDSDNLVFNRTVSLKDNYKLPPKS